MEDDGKWFFFLWFVDFKVRMTMLILRGVPFLFGWQRLKTKWNRTVEVQDQIYRIALSLDPCKGFHTTKGQSLLFGLPGEYNPKKPLKYINDHRSRDSASGAYVAQQVPKASNHMVQHLKREGFCLPLTLRHFHTYAHHMIYTPLAANRQGLHSKFTSAQDRRSCLLYQI